MSIETEQARPSTSGHEFTKAAVARILAQPETSKWTVQGLGMLRTYLDADKKIRLHVWHSDMVTEDVTAMHTHPWDMQSLIVGGVIRQTRYRPLNKSGRVWYQEQKIQCGEGGGAVGFPSIVPLCKDEVEVYREGDTYSQLAEEIHSTAPFDGTVTLVRRIFRPDTEHAYVYVPDGQEWVSAEPRPATLDEAWTACNYALGRWFS